MFGEKTHTHINVTKFHFLPWKQKLGNNLQHMVRVGFKMQPPFSFTTGIRVGGNLTQNYLEPKKKIFNLRNILKEIPFSL